MQRRGWIITAAVTAASIAALTAAWPQDAPRVATGFIAGELCSATFVSGLDPEQVFNEITAATSGAGLIAWGFHVDVDRNRRQVTTTLFGGGESRAVYRDGLGCMPALGDVPADTTLPRGDTETPALLPEIAGPAPVETSNPELRRALDDAFAEPGGSLSRHTRAIVVVKDGRVIAERYAPGYGVATPLHGFSMTKSVIGALVGVLVRQGRLAVGQPAPLAQWRDPGDPHHAITIDELLRHTSGLKLGSSLSASLGSTLAPVNRMKFVVRDRAAFAADAPLEAAPGTLWNYQDGNYVILSRILRDATGGHAADVLQFAQRELFGPLGMNHVTLEVDATGTPEGSSQMFAPARTWAKFGLLYLNDGVVGGKRILPEGWAAYSARPTSGAFVGYGAGWWTNLGDSEGAQRRIGFGMPRDAIHARGQFGQYVIVIPSQRLVIVRLGMTSNGGDGEGVSHFVADVIAATNARASHAAASR
jgi:CubicO group peptidase (beta-lactamase class C family)